jgi:hypothetical protein
MATTRKRSSALTTAEQNRYRDGVTQLIESGFYGQLVAGLRPVQRSPRDVNQAHAGDLLDLRRDRGPAADSLCAESGAWGHEPRSAWRYGRDRDRALPALADDFLLQLEGELQRRDSAASIPYWDWTVERAVPSWMQDFLPTVPVPGRRNTVQVRRSTGAVRWAPSCCRQRTHCSGCITRKSIGFGVFGNRLQATREKVRLCLAATQFWVPMDRTRVRHAVNFTAELFVRAVERWLAHQPTI